MAKFPVEISDNEGIVDAVNYLLAGPTSTGQGPQGFHSSSQAFITGNYRTPYTKTTANLTVDAIALGNSTWLNDFTFKHEFASAQAVAPFQLGNNITVRGVTPSLYNGTYSRVGVVECTTTYVIARTTTSYTNPGTGTGGYVYLDAAEQDATLSTDCNGRVTVNGAAQVLLSAQLNNKFTYSTDGVTSTEYVVAIDRYKAFPNNDPINPDFFFNFDATVAEKKYLFSLPDTTTAATSFTVSGTKALTTYPATYDIVNPTSATGTGSGVNVRITINASAIGTYSSANTTVEVYDGGEGYAVGDTIIIPGNQLGAATTANDMTLTVATIGSIAGVVPEETVDTVFTTFIDKPNPGYYWYILDVQWVQLTNVATIKKAEVGLRSLTAEVIK